MAIDPNDRGTPGRATSQPASDSEPSDRTENPSLGVVWNAIEKFSEREHRVLRFVAAGYITKEIAGLEGQTENAIEQVIKRARSKCGGIGRPELIRAYNGWEKAASKRSATAQPDGQEGTQRDPFSADRISALARMVDDEPKVPSVHRDDASGKSDLQAQPYGGADAIEMLLRLPVGLGGSARNALIRPSSTLVIFLIALVSVVFAGAILALLNSADHLQIGH